MPLLDVNDAFDPSFMDDIVVIRRSQTINAVGRGVDTPQTFSAQAVVVAASPDDLQRVPEEEWMNKTISITTAFRLQGPAIDEAGNITDADQILWHNSVYVIRSLDDFSGYGRGFVNAVAVSIQPIDPPPIPSPVGSA